MRGAPNSIIKRPNKTNKNKLVISKEFRNPLHSPGIANGYANATKSELKIRFAFVI